MITNNTRMNSPSYKGFQDGYLDMKEIRLQAQAQNNNGFLNNNGYGFLFRQDFLPAIGDYRIVEEFAAFKRQKGIY